MGSAILALHSQGSSVRTFRDGEKLCVPIKFAALLASAALSRLRYARMGLPAPKAEAPPTPSVTDFWVEQIGSTDSNEDGGGVYIFKNPATGRKVDAVGLCPDAGPEKRESGGNVEIKII
jgi:hypothetical protein